MRVVALLIVSLGLGLAGCGDLPTDGSGGGIEGDATGGDDPDRTARNGGVTTLGLASGAQIASVNVQVVFTVVMENHSAGQIYGNTTHAPYINGTLMPLGARADRFIDELPLLPSEPHYMMMEAGTNRFADHVFSGDADPSWTNSTSSTAHLTRQLDRAGVSWMSYQEGLNAQTGPCPVDSHALYAAKHNPFVFFRDVAGRPPRKLNAYCARHHKPFSALAVDLADEAVAAYNFITPNLCHDMHGDGACLTNDDVRAGDDWLASHLPAVLDYAEAHEGVVIVAWDEPQGAGTIPLVVLGPHVLQGAVSQVEYSHRSYLKSVEEMLGVPVLPKVQSANDFADLFEPGYFP